MDTRERIKKMFEKTEPIMQAVRKDKSERLKPCPFCGADDGHGVCVRCLWPYETYEVFCENCGASSKEFIRKEQAVEAWNRRVSDV